MRLAILAAAPRVTGATAQSQAQQQAATDSAAFSANSHPRGADGRFIATGGTVQVLGADGKPMAEGTATVVVTAQGPMIQVKSPTTGQIISVPPSQVIQAPVSIATLGAPGSQGIPTGPGGAARAGKSDARLGIPPRSGVDALGQKATSDLLNSYTAAYQAEVAHLKTIADKKAVVAQKKVAAAAKKAAALAKKNSKKAGGSAYIGPAPTMSSKRIYYR